MSDGPAAGGSVGVRPFQPHPIAGFGPEQQMYNKNFVEDVVSYVLVCYIA